jgi:hypothetical protein
VGRRELIPRCDEGKNRCHDLQLAAENFFFLEMGEDKWCLQTAHSIIISTELVASLKYYFLRQIKP